MSDTRNDLTLPVTVDIDAEALADFVARSWNIDDVIHFIRNLDESYSDWDFSRALKAVAAELNANDPRETR